VHHVPDHPIGEVESGNIAAQRIDAEVLGLEFAVAYLEMVAGHGALTVVIGPEILSAPKMLTLRVVTCSILNGGSRFVAPNYVCIHSTAASVGGLLHFSAIRHLLF
jgi:hypothetical protein